MRAAEHYLDGVPLPGALPVLGAAAVLVGSAVLAALMPAAKASRVDVLQAEVCQGTGSIGRAQNASYTVRRTV